jgi:regulatory protein
LKFRKISEYCIKQGLLEISDEDYLETLKQVVEKKSHQLKSEKKSPLKQRKIAVYVISRGFESDLVWGVLNDR